ncbi:cytochrome P450 2C40-like [Haemaphysalis longicornis]
MDIVILNDLESIKKYLNKKELLHRARCLLTDREYYVGIGTVNGEEWDANRKFCMNMLRNLGFAKTAMEERMMEEFRIFRGKLEEANGEAVDIKKYLLGCVANNIAWFVFPLESAGLEGARHQMTSAMERLRTLLSTGPPFVMWPSMVRKVVQFIPSTRSWLMNGVFRKMDEITL